MLTNNQISEHLEGDVLTLLVTVKEVQSSASSKRLAAPLIHSPQLLVR